MNVKLTARDMTTYGGMKWTVGEWQEAPGKGELCTAGWLHYYRSPLLAVLHNPIHAALNDPRLWEVEVEGAQKHEGYMKSGAQRIRLIRELPLPVLTLPQRVRYAIECVRAGVPVLSADWSRWAVAWCDGTNRSTEAAWVAAQAAWAAWAAVVAQSAQAAQSAWVAAQVAQAAWVAAQAAEAAQAAAWAADAAEMSAAVAARAGTSSDLRLDEIAEAAIAAERSEGL